MAGVGVGNLSHNHIWSNPMASNKTTLGHKVKLDNEKCAYCGSYAHLIECEWNRSLFHDEAPTLIQHMKNYYSLCHTCDRCLEALGKGE